MKTKSTLPLLLTSFFLLFTQYSISQIPGKYPQSSLPLFPEVSGFGLDTKGGQGGKIIRVTNLNSEGKGSLQEAIQAEGPRIIVFEVAGTINLERESLRINNPYATIAGQTAPYPGITLVRGGLGILTHDVIIQHIKVRTGEAGQDHCKSQDHRAVRKLHQD